VRKFIIFSIVLLFPVCLFAQRSGHVNGRIIDTNKEAVAFISIRLVEINKGTQTNDNGYFDFFKVPAGKYTLEVSGIGFEAQKQNIEVMEGKRTELALQLNKQDNTLQEVVISSRTMRRYNSTTTEETKLPGNLIDLPLTIRVIDRGLIDERQASEFRQVVKNMTGVTLTTANGDFMMRGFQNTGGNNSGSAQLINGMKNFYTGYTNDLNLLNVERIEVLKGPTSILYGANAPGGNFNIITKKPLETNRYTVGASFGSWGRYRADADLTGNLSKDKKLLYRFNTSYQSNPDYRDFIYNKNFAVAPSIRYKPSEKTTIDIELAHNSINRSVWFDWGVPAWNDNVLAVPIKYTSHEPTDNVQIRNTMLSFQLQHRFTPTLSFHSGFNGSGNNVEGHTHSPSFFNPVPKPDSSVSRVYREMIINNSASFFTNYLVWEPTVANVRFRITGGIDYYKNKYYSDIKQAGWANGVPSINIFQPKYQQASERSYTFSQSLSETTFTEYWGGYLMGFIDFNDKLKVMLSGRYDVYKFRYLMANSSNDSKPFLPNVGVSYQPVKGLSIYGSWNKGFLPQTDQSIDFGGPFDPQYSEQYEGGIKKEFFNGRYSITAAYYEIKRKNMLVPIDPVNDPWGKREATGSAKSKGVEIDIAGNVLPNLNINAGYTYNDSRITRSAFDIEIDRQATNAPYHSAHLWARYNFTRGALKDFGIAFGSNYVGVRTTDGSLSYPAPVLQRLPAYQTVDLALFYRYQNLQFSANLDNAFDEQYIYGALNAFYMQRGLPRNVLFRTQINF
jgi:iron complex outermembrane receptor protein